MAAATTTTPSHLLDLPFFQDEFDLEVTNPNTWQQIVHVSRECNENKDFTTFIMLLDGGFQQHPNVMPVLVRRCSLALVQLNKEGHLPDLYQRVERILVENPEIEDAPSVEECAIMDEVRRQYIASNQWDTRLSYEMIQQRARRPPPYRRYSALFSDSHWIQRLTLVIAVKNIWTDVDMIYMFVIFGLFLPICLIGASGAMSSSLMMNVPVSFLLAYTVLVGLQGIMVFIVSTLFRSRRMLAMPMLSIRMFCVTLLDGFTCAWVANVISNSDNDFVQGTMMTDTIPLLLEQVVVLLLCASFGADVMDPSGSVIID